MHVIELSVLPMIGPFLLFFIVQLLLPLVTGRHGWPPMSIKRHRHALPRLVHHGTWGMGTACYLLLQPFTIPVWIRVPMVSTHGRLPPSIVLLGLLRPVGSNSLPVLMVSV